MALQTLCIRFIASHAELLDSLEGFPEEIGKRLWDALMTLPDKFHGHQGAKILANFAQAYPSLILETCRLCDIVVLDKYDLQFFALFQFVQELDLSGCKIGSEHDLLPRIHSFQSLSRLSLSDNVLNDSAMANLINPFLYKGGFCRLIELDLTKNPLLTSKSVSRCLKVPNLQRLVLSLDVESEFSKVLRKKNRIDWKKIETRGWALHLVEIWKDETRTKFKHQPSQPTFYGRPRPSVNTPQTLTSPSNSPIFMYERRRELKRQLDVVSTTFTSSMTDDQHDHDILNKYYKKYLYRFLRAANTSKILLETGGPNFSCVVQPS